MDSNGYDHNGYDFSRLPKSEHAKAIAACNEFNIMPLLILHNKYKLSIYEYKCCGLDGLVAHFKIAIENGQITAD